MREGILLPLGMTRSSFLEADLDPDLRTTPHVGRREPEIGEVYPYHRAHAPSSTLHSNVEEMCTWIIASVNRGVLEPAADESVGGARILAEESYEQLWTPQVEARPGRQFGLAWMLGDSPHGLWALHGGRDPGFRSHLSIFPDELSGLVILSNYSETPIPPLRDALSKAILGP